MFNFCCSFHMFNINEPGASSEQPPLALLANPRAWQLLAGMTLLKSDLLRSSLLWWLFVIPVLNIMWTLYNFWAYLHFTWNNSACDFRWLFFQAVLFAGQDSWHLLAPRFAQLSASSDFFNCNDVLSIPLNHLMSTILLAQISWAKSLVVPLLAFFTNPLIALPFRIDTKALYRHGWNGINSFLSILLNLSSNVFLLAN